MATPREIRKRAGGSGLMILWDDGHASEWTAQQLRRLCRCAACRDERTGEMILKPEQVSDEIRIGALEPVGRYALGLSFSDGHASGIYSFDHLRNDPAS